ncbi:amidohydrolase [Halobacterium noricense]|uniref:amidohydrolase n=1 Tax=Halobacterium noricense TaxID=223182 RepID=UPI001E5B5D64|nr:amidohydrolase [Halobacterium noricense]UHH24868.1 amidohydrolase [Halobacterium noricense]
MTAAADLVLRNGEVHTLGGAEETYDALAVRDGRVVQLANDYDVEFLVGTGTEVLDVDGGVVLPGFVDAHTHMETVGQYGVHADLRGASGPEEITERLQERAAETDEEWVLGYGYDESAWDADDLHQSDLDAVSDERPVAAIREDMHTATVNAVALDAYGEEMPDGDVLGDGRIVEDAVEVVYEATEPDPEETESLLRAAQREANEKGVTCVHDMVRQSHSPRAFRELDLADELTVRVRLNYWSDHLDALLETGLRTNHGSGMVEVGGVKTYTDGSLGGHTAKLSEPYADAPDEAGQWVVDPGDLREFVARADDAGLQVTAHAIGDEAIDAVLDAYEACADAGESRHRIEHAELASDDVIERMSELGVVASMQPNFLKWAGSEGLYEDRLGTERREASNRFPAYRDSDVPLAFGSDCMPLDPLLGVHYAVNPPTEPQALSVTDALRAYTAGGAYAGFREDEMGTIEVGAFADFVVLDESPWKQPEAIRDIDVQATVVDGDVVYRTD